MHLRKIPVPPDSESKHVYRTNFCLPARTRSLRRMCKFWEKWREFRRLEMSWCTKGYACGLLGVGRGPQNTRLWAHSPLFLLWSFEGDSRLLWEAAGKPVVLAEPPGEGDGPAEGGRPGPVGLPRLHSADPNPHLRALATVHPVQGALHVLLREAPRLCCHPGQGRITAAVFMGVL